MVIPLTEVTDEIYIFVYIKTHSTHGFAEVITIMKQGYVFL